MVHKSAEIDIMNFILLLTDLLTIIIYLMKAALFRRSVIYV